MNLLEKIKIKISIVINKLSKPVMYHNGNLEIKHKGKGVRVSSTTFIDHSDNLFLGDHVYIGQFNYIEASNSISIERGCQITNYVTITSHSSHDSIRLYGKKYLYHKEHIGYQKGKVFIGSYSYIGPYTLITPGTTIGKGSIVKSHSVLKGTYPDFSIIDGNPAVVIGDTRERDEKYLLLHPELKSIYYLNESE